MVSSLKDESKQLVPDLILTLECKESYLQIQKTAPAPKTA